MGGPGLGNLLFPWARSHVLAAMNGGVVIRPTWPQLKIGPLLRREADLRWYGHLFARNAAEVSGLARAWLLLRASRVDESRYENAPDGSVIEVRGMQGLFSALYGHHALVAARLWAVARPVVLQRAQTQVGRAIAVHVRLGDFASARDTGARRAGAANTRIPLDWYRSVVQRLRDDLGKCVPVVVFSDGKDADLAPLLSLPATTRHPSLDALSDLLALTRFGCLVASGSTFSMWASYLGQVPTVWFPGQRWQQLLVNDAQECEYEAGPLPDSFVAQVESILLPNETN
jgi:hypothetical protein